ncbi:putative membrane protein SpoIIM required for sporulation [Methanohalophilus levihalophilus]|uniref:stage II sporulation protein M n=1 Tax=Methanohalophilus levihalophilus TaxID=1431282 RepID=UPI001AEA7E98|nr:stage II sporulation protein M [Methanohalophilus levihalophilus]MBP2029925.1 putative membrane protein SpoIIM required for sporulation [Methanohalophilus levihalophilus]
MEHDENKHELKKGFFWSARLFLLSAILAFAVAILVYAAVIFFSQTPAPINQAVSGTTNSALAKVEVGARYVGLTASIFVFNSIAAFTGSAGAALIVFVHRMLLSDLDLRKKYPIYGKLSKKTESWGRPFSGLFRRLFPSTYASFSNDEVHKSEDSIWNYYGYDRGQYRMFASMLPYAPPFLVSVANGVLAGILLAFMAVNGSVEGMNIFGNTGIFTGALAGIAYFMAFIIPHGIIEIPALFLSAGLGYVFASRQATVVKNELLFSGNYVDDLKKDISKTEKCASKFLKSAYFRKAIFACVCLLLIASYIETEITPEIGAAIFEFVLDYLN